MEFHHLQPFTIIQSIIISTKKYWGGDEGGVHIWGIHVGGSGRCTSASIGIISNSKHAKERNAFLGDKECLRPVR